MKQVHAFFITLFIATFLVPIDLSAQKFPALDKSPVDISYYRMNKQAAIKVIYSRPQKNGREVFGNLVPYDKVWRTGANECSEIKFYKDALLAGLEVKAGTYALFTIPGKEKWTIILNNGLDQWGAFGYDAAEDALRVEVPVRPTDEPVEAFAITFSESEDGAVNLVLAWDRTKVEVPVAMK